MTSFGIAEIGLVLVLVLISFDAKQIGKALKWFSSLRSKFYRMQRDFKYQFDNLLAEEEEKEELKKIHNSVDEMRKWGARKAHSMTYVNKYKAAKGATEFIMDFPPYKGASTVALYSALHDELDTSQLIKRILSEEKKVLLLPYITEQRMFMAPVREFEKDTAPGPFGILEPVESLREESVPSPDLIIIPGRCFDAQGGRIGRGKGYYDRYLANQKGIRVGLCYDVQISGSPLNLRPHDKKMAYIISDKRIMHVQEKVE